MELIFTGLFCFLPVFTVSILIGAFWFWMFVECLTKEPSTGNDKLIWIVIMLVLIPPGAFLYYFIRRPQRIRDVGE